ncbi:MCE family protein [Nocardioides sp. Kera G14]|uniref:MCE family protein n=1 Tax=Nocardioides sp. Kera G14 TaxID=2884264 RepID=UPI001D12327E|nr:MlaD family protein [Nocardioides sp. Kera G14]UDY23971.1 MCE family protein [Nocardioides sp. Kera G14]
MSRTGLDKKTSQDLVRLGIFMVITAMATGLLVLTIGNISFGGTEKYKAVFSDATGMAKGDDVRIAGVKVGTVKDIQITDRTKALVTFSVSDDQHIAAATHATIRYRNIVGQRYLALTDTLDGGVQLHPGQVIPISQTQPSLDLSTLFNGFKPLFQALSPDDINKLSYEIVQVFQGEGGTLESLLTHTASVTQTLSDRDAVIDSLIDNLNQVLDHLGDRDQQLSQLITTFRTFVGGLAEDKDAILGSLDQISAVSVQTADLLKGLRGPFPEDIKQLRKVATNINGNKAELDRALQVLPIKLNKVGNVGSYGSWFNFFLCNFNGAVKLPGNQQIKLGTDTLKFNAGTRCNLG